MNLFAINWWIVPIGLLVSMINGSIWYNPKTFFPYWWKIVGGGKETPSMEGMGLVWGMTALSAIIKTIFIGIAMNAFAPALGGFSLVNGLLCGFLLWAGVVLPTYLVNKLFAGHGFGVWAIEIGNHLIDFLVLGALYGVWQLA